jgi:hypothetical protein
MINYEYCVWRSFGMFDVLCLFFVLRCLKQWTNIYVKHEIIEATSNHLRSSMRNDAESELGTSSRGAGSVLKRLPQGAWWVLGLCGVKGSLGGWELGVCTSTWNLQPVI